MYGRVQDFLLRMIVILQLDSPFFVGLWASCDGAFDSAFGLASVGVVVHDSLGSIVASNSKLVRLPLLLWLKLLPFGMLAI